jgi:acyl-CoA thioester hydrolase
MAEIETRERYRHFLSIQTRFLDNDAYGHLNNVVYYSLFDTVINRYLVEYGGLDVAAGPVIGLCVESHCRFDRPTAFPDVLEAGLRVAHLGRSSVRYEVGVFARGEEEASAHGWFVHVFVDRATRRPAPLPATIRGALEKLRRPEGGPVSA